MQDNNDKKTETAEEEKPSVEIAQGGNEVRPRRGRPPNPQSATPNQVEAMYQKLMTEVQERPEADLLDDAGLNEHNKKLFRQIQIILNEDFKMMTPKNMARVATPNGIQKFEITGLSKDQRDHLREMFKILATTIKLFEEQQPAGAGGSLGELTKQLYKGIPGVK